LKTKFGNFIVLNAWIFYIFDEKVQMNYYFLPNEVESEYLSKLANVFDEEYTYIRLTQTMIDKSIIDASEGIRYLLEKGKIVDYTALSQGDKIVGKAIIFYQEEIIEKKVSYYRPKTKKGDPRFWVYGLTKYAETGDLVYFTILNHTLIVLPFSATRGQLENFTDFAKRYSGETEILTLLHKQLTKIKSGGWIESVSPYVDNPKDVGDTLEAAMGIQVNNLKTPDFMGKIELKAKRSKAKTLDTLFGKVPDWEISNYKSVLSIVDRFGYISDGYPMKRLYNDIKSSPNTQGLYSMPDDKTGKLFQKYRKDNQEEEVCAWWYSTIRDALNTKHPTTLWVKADRELIDGKFYFNFIEFELSTRPNFSEFIRLILADKIIYDWKAKIKLNGTSIRNHGPGFRIKSKNKEQLFNSLIVLK